MTTSSSNAIFFSLAQESLILFDFEEGPVRETQIDVSRGSGATFYVLPYMLRFSQGQSRTFLPGSDRIHVWSSTPSIHLWLIHLWGYDWHYLNYFIEYCLISFSFNLEIAKLINNLHNNKSTDFLIIFLDSICTHRDLEGWPHIGKFPLPILIPQRHPPHTLTRGDWGEKPPPNFGKSRLGVRGGKRKKRGRKGKGERDKREREEKKEKIVN